MKILLIDDHVLFRDGLALLLARLEPDIFAIGAGTCEEGFRLIDSYGNVDLVLIDLNMPGMPGMDGIVVLRERHPEIPVVVISSDDDMETVLRAIDQGAMGFIPKSATSDVMIGALKLILAKGIYLPPSVFMGKRQIPGATVVKEAPQAPATVDVPGIALARLGLTPRQIEVLYLVLQGKSAKIICRELDLSISTVKAHTSAVLRALNVTTRTQAVVAAGKLGLMFGAVAP